MRKLVSLETIVDIRPIHEADAIEAVVVRGWIVVSKRGEFQVGDQCVYFEIDSALPLSDSRFEFLGSRGTNTTVTGNKVHVLKTARLRGVYSQGLVLPFNQFPEFDGIDTDVDLAALIGVEKWEPPLPATMGGDMVGAFPTSLARKTDAERIQNLTEHFDVLRQRHRWVATEKLDGTSATFLNDDGMLRVCGRNWEMADGPNVYWEMARNLRIAERLEPGWVVQGEIYGEGVQSNPLKVRGRHLGIFGVFADRVPVEPKDWPEWAKSLAVPEIDFDLDRFESIDAIVAAVDGLKSVIAPDRLAEGLVFQTADRAEVPELDFRSCFKVISNRYLLKHQ
jgi:RNA ligase (TIGR02306 family)